MKKTTLNEVSEYTQLSKTTISRVLNGKSREFRINRHTQERVIAAAQELNYKPQLVAQLLHKKPMRTIGIVMPNLSNPFFASLASAISVEAKKHELFVMLFDTQEDPVQEESALNKMLEYRVDGIVIVPCGRDARKLEKINRTIPVVQVDRYFEESDLSYVSTNNFRGAYEAMSLLLNSGHRNVICIQGPTFSVTNRERIRGCRKAIEDYGEQCSLLVLGNDFSIQNGYIEGQLALSRRPRPTAIFAMSNTIMLGTMRAIKEHHLVIPDDISLLSFDDNIYIDYLNPPVTRVAQPVSSMGIAAIKMLVNSIQQEGELHSTMLLTPSIINRNSIKILNP
ncbi:MAG: LacI family DNA-binding transcriptional regulator [Bacteroidaceae bacterium]|jgi:LacI family transcriptional regulator|nr:LacI family DNA-binding transcriptional regulator [Bacteroidaceae bacterium]MBR3372646.1 LacI family DNA-binding transcriptional regulator [Bacteroidaceae bacterium]MBR4649751.1 LacI family DNA-binding transcriptional regulator [Bacteroidaceae bacterium]MBR6713858.1 LacI family DNA-binding transcriptional regulator [Bacteroidaceae bacterium]